LGAAFSRNEYRASFLKNGEGQIRPSFANTEYVTQLPSIKAVWPGSAKYSTASPITDLALDSVCEQKELLRYAQECETRWKTKDDVKATD
jgi:hypothetical protein